MNLSKHRSAIRLFVLIMSVLVFPSCGTIPGAGPFNNDVRNSADISVKLEEKNSQDEEKLFYALLEVTKPLLTIIDKTSNSTLSQNQWPELKTPNDILVSVGDTLNITIYEAKSGGLFIPKEAGVRPGNFINLPTQVVDSSGSISVPYVGNIGVVGLTTQKIEQYITEKLMDRAIDPQVIVTFGERSGSEVSIIGEVNSPRRYSLNFNGERILDALARAGGPKAPAYESYVSLQRDGLEQTLLMDDIVLNPIKNVFLKPDDIVYVYRQPNTYSVFGAAMKNGRYEFGKRELVLSEAIGQAEGLDNQQADASEIFVFRDIDSSILKELMLKEESNERKFELFDDDVKAIFHFNLREPKGYFYTQNFSVKDNDIIFIPDADTVDLQKFLLILSPTSATAVNIKTLN